MHWWLRVEDLWLYETLWSFLDFMGASAFLFISGVSTALSYRNQKNENENSEHENLKRTRNEYLFRIRKS